MCKDFSVVANDKAMSLTLISFTKNEVFLEAQANIWFPKSRTATVRSNNLARFPQFSHFLGFWSEIPEKIRFFKIQLKKPQKLPNFGGETNLLNTL